MAGRRPLPTAVDELPLTVVVDEVFLDFRRKSAELLDPLPATVRSVFTKNLRDLSREIRVSSEDLIFSSTLFTSSHQD
jgi:hypothetical protein